MIISIHLWLNWIIKTLHLGDFDKRYLNIDMSIINNATGMMNMNTDKKFNRLDIDRATAAREALTDIYGAPFLHASPNGVIEYRWKNVSFRVEAAR